MEKISVVVPVYNVEKYLERCIKSILGQTYSNLELILVDDGSTDHSPEICDAYQKADDRVRVLHKENTGAGDSRNQGIDLAQGEYITFIDSDDYISEKFLEILHETMQKEQCQIVQCGYLFGKEENYPFPLEEKKVQVFDRREAFMTRDTKIIMCAKLFRRELFDEIRYPKVSVHDDEFITYRLIYQADKIALIDLPLYYYYDSSGSIMRARRDYYPENFVKAYEERIAFFIEHKEPQLVLISYKERAVRLVLFYSQCKAQKNNKNDTKALRRLFCEDYQKAKKAPMSSKEKILLTLFYYIPGLTAFIVAKLRKNM